MTHPNLSEAVFTFGQQVHIPAIEVTGNVRSISFDERGIMYKVIYRFNGERKESWVYPDEIARVDNA